MVAVVVRGGVRARGPWSAPAQREIARARQERRPTTTVYGATGATVSEPFANGRAPLDVPKYD